MNFLNKLEKIVKKHNSLVCVGLDPVKCPFFEFNKWIINQTHHHICAYKPNSAFYEGKGIEGVKQLKTTFDYIHENYPEIVTILDAKRADIGNTNNGYVKFIFDYLRADAVTLNPYLGREALQPFLERKNKGCIILCRTSNPGAGEFQDLKTPKPLYEVVAQKVSKEWNTNKNCLLVVGATYPKELKEVRKIVGDDIWFLVPGIGAQGGDIKQTVLAGQNRKGTGMIINSSRGIIFSKNPQQEAQKLRDEINKYRKEMK